MAKFHRVFKLTNKLASGSVRVKDIPWQDNDNEGLPNWFFEGAFFSFTVDTDHDLVEWIPECGPSPCWEAKFSSFADDEAMLQAWDSWVRATY